MKFWERKQPTPAELAGRALLVECSQCGTWQVGGRRDLGQTQAVVPCMKCSAGASSLTPVEPTEENAARAQRDMAAVSERWKRAFQGFAKATAHLPDSAEVGEIAPDGSMRVWSPEERTRNLFDKLTGGQGGQDDGQ